MTPAPAPAPGSNIAPPGVAELLLKPGRGVPTSVQQTDARGALCRGLREYLTQLVWNAEGGRQLRFEKVRDNWAEPEQNAKYPSAAVYTTTTGNYTAAGFTPTVTNDNKLPEPDGRFIVSPATLEQELTLEVWANDPKERMQLMALMEDALNPVIYRYGFQLRLPFYFNEVATFTLTSQTVNDSDENAVRRYRVAVFTLMGIVPVRKLVSLPLAKPRFELRDIGTEASVLVQAEVT